MPLAEFPQLSAKSGRAANWEPIAVRAPTSPTEPTPDDIGFLKQFGYRDFDYAYHLVDRTAHARGEWTSMEGRRHPPISDEDLRRHLKQDRSLAVYCAVSTDAAGLSRAETPWLMIDLDRHDSDTDLVRRFREVRAALGAPTFVVASPRGGAHAFYCLDERTHIYELHDVDTPRGIVAQLLGAHGVRVARGQVEIYPTPRSRNRKGNVARLPFGVGSWLLDSWDLTLHSAHVQGVDALRWVRDGLSSGELPITAVQDWRAAAVTVGTLTTAARPRGAQSALTVARMKMAPFRGGLVASGTREIAVAAHVFQSRALGQSLEEATQSAKEWLTAYHNGNSRTIESRGLSHALTEVESTAERIYRAKRGNGVSTRVPLPALTVAEAQPIIDFAMDAARCVDTNGKPLEAFWVAHHAFWLFRYAVQEALTNVRDQEVLRRDDGTTRLTGRAWPDCTQARFVVPISWALRRKKITDANGKLSFTAPAGQESEIFEALCVGPTALLRKVHGHYHSGGMCAYFEIRLDFEGDRCIADIGSAFSLAAGGLRCVRERLRARHWKRVAPAFMSRPDAANTIPASSEMLKARALHEEALRRAAAGWASELALRGSQATQEPVEARRPRPSHWLTSALTCVDECQEPQSASAAASQVGQGDEVSRDAGGDSHPQNPSSSAGDAVWSVSGTPALRAVVGEVPATGGAVPMLPDPAAPSEWSRRAA